MFPTGIMLATTHITFTFRKQPVLSKSVHDLYAFSGLLYNVLHMASPPSFILASLMAKGGGTSA